MIRLIIFSFILSIAEINAQTDSVATYYANGNIESIVHIKNNMRDGDAKFFWENGKIREELTYTNGRIEGLVRRYNEKGFLQEMYTIENGKREGPTSIFDSTGTYINDIFYEEGMLVVDKIVLDSGDHFREYKKKEDAEIKSPDEQKNNNSISDKPLPPVVEEEKNYESDTTFYQTADVMPEPVGGMNAIIKKIVYPQQAKENNIEGEVKVLALIDRDGEVLDAKIQNGIGYGCDEAARLAVFYHRFKPGIIKGQRVRMQIEVPVEFKLPPKE